MQYYTLLQVCQWIDKKLQDVKNKKFWVLAEIHKLNYYNLSGHCYPELVDKKDWKIVAQMRGIIWSSYFLKIDKKFRKITGEWLKDWIKVLLYVSIDYNYEKWLSLIVWDADPRYTQGDLQLQRQQTINKLKQLGIFDLNKSVKFPFLPFRIAVISTITSKWYSDFKKVIDNSKYNINLTLFEAILQWDKAIDTIISQLENIEKQKDKFDLVVIVRWWGGDSTLVAYDNFELAKKIAEFPLPVLTWIWHSTNQTIVDLVAYRSFITPTELAQYIVYLFEQVEFSLNNFKNNITNFIQNKLIFLKQNIQSYKNFFKTWFKNFIFHKNNQIVYLKEKFFKSIENYFQNKQNLINHFYLKLDQSLVRYLDNKKNKLNLK